MDEQHVPSRFTRRATLVWACLGIVGLLILRRYSSNAIENEGHFVPVEKVNMAPALPNDKRNDPNLPITSSENAFEHENDNKTMQEEPEWFQAVCDKSLDERYNRGYNRTVVVTNTGRKIRWRLFKTRPERYNKSVNGSSSIARTISIAVPPVLKSWCKDVQTGTYRYFDKESHLMRRTWKGVEKCLENKHVIMIGNSLVRYLFLSFVKLLTFREWDHCLEQNESEHHADDEEEEDDGDAEERSISPDDITNGNGEEVLTRPEEDLRRCGFTYVKYHDGFNKFYSNIVQTVRTKDDQANYMCYCHRTRYEEFDEGSRGNSTFFDKTFLTFNRSREVHYFAKGSIRLTYLSNFYDRIRIHPKLPPFTRVHRTEWAKAQHDVCEAGNCNQTVIDEALEFTTRQALRELVPKLHPTHLFVMGWNQDDIGCVVKEYQEKYKTKAWYLSHPRSFQGPPKPVKQGCGVKVLDLFSVTRRLPKFLYMVDGMHVSSSVNQEFNQMMLNAICGEYEGEDQL